MSCGALCPGCALSHRFAMSRKIRTDEVQVGVGHRLVDHDLGARGVDYARGDEVQVRKNEAP